MPTADRREFIPRALRCFAAQTYPNLELIVVDDGTDKIGDLLIAQRKPEVVRFPITYLPSFPIKENHGQKMNTACAYANGEFCIVWDDDDFYAPDRVFRQIAPLLAAPNYDICGLANLFYYDKAKQKAWRYIADESEWLGSIAFRRSEWDAKRFAEIPSGCDRRFQLEHKGKVIAVHGDAVACAIHATNAGFTNPENKIAKHPEFFTPIDYQTVVDFTKGDL